MCARIRGTIKVAYYSSALNIQYNYSATQNNGKITSQTDVISGEQIAYTYDALNRLASAETTQTGGTQWNAGGVQGAKMGLFFGVVNAFQWAAH